MKRGSWHLIPALIFTIGIGALTAIPSGAAEADAETIEQLIAKLSSIRFTEREKAHAELEKIGLPAMAALQKAAKSNDMETARRATEILEKLEIVSQRQKVLQPTYVELNYQDTPLNKALADFSKKTGYQFTPTKSTQAILGKKITLKTGKVTFWEAYDRFMAAAGLIEGTIADLQNAGQPTRPTYPPQIDLPNAPVPQPAVPQIRNLLPVQQGIAIPAQQIKIKKQIKEVQKQIEQKKAEALKRLKLKKAAEEAAKKKAAEEKAQKEAEKRKAAQKARLQAQQQQIAQIKQMIQVQVAQQAQVLQPQIGGSYPYVPSQPGLPTNQIVVKPGKLVQYPTIYVGAVRIRLLVDKIQNGNDSLTVPLELTPEPKLQWQQVDSISLTTALDDLGQELMQVMGNNTQPNNGIVYPGNFRNVGIAINFETSYYRPTPVPQSRKHIVNLNLKAGDKKSSAIKELRGSLNARLLSAAEKLITIKDVTKGKQTVKGKKGGAIQVLSFSTIGNDRVQVQLQFERPNGVVPVNQINQPLPNGIMNNRLGQIRGRRGLVPYYGGNNTGLILYDVNGKPIRQVGTNTRGIANAGGVVSYQYTLTYQLSKGQKAGELSFLGRMPNTVEVPFTFKDVKLK